MAISQLLTRAFRGKDGGILELETLGEILGNEDYTEMDYAKVVGIFTDLYALLAENKPPVPARKDISNGSWGLMDVILNLEDVKKSFTNPYGRRLVTINPRDKNLFDLAKQDGAAGMAYRYALKHLHPFVIEDGSLFTEQNLGGKLNEYELLKLYKKDDASTYSGMTDEYIVKKDSNAAIHIRKRKSSNIKTSRSGLFIQRFGTGYYARQFSYGYFSNK